MRVPRGGPPELAPNPHRPAQFLRTVYRLRRYRDDTLGREEIAAHCCRTRDARMSISIRLTMAFIALYATLAVLIGSELHLFS